MYKKMALPYIKLSMPRYRLQSIINNTFLAKMV